MWKWFEILLAANDETPKALYRHTYAHIYKYIYVYIYMFM